MVKVIDLPEASIHRPPKDYLIISVLNSIFCCICLGIPALIFSVKTKEATKYGHFQKAFEYSRKSMKFNILAFVLGLLAILIFFFFHHIFVNHILYNRNPHYDNRHQRPYNSGFGGPNGGGGF